MPDPSPLSFGQRAVFFAPGNAGLGLPGTFDVARSILYEDEKRFLSETEQTEQSPPFRFTGDGLAMLSGLIVSGLIEISRRFSGASFFGGGMPSFEVRLTVRGKQLVEAWLSGHPENVAKALSANSGGADKQ